MSAINDLLEELGGLATDIQIKIHDNKELLSECNQSKLNNIVTKIEYVKLDLVFIQNDLER